MKIIVSKSFYPLFENKARYLVLVGGRGSGKSEFAARKIFYRCMKEGGHRFLILRKVRDTVKKSVIEVMRRLLEENSVAFDYNKTDRIFSFTSPNGKRNEVLFDGLDEPGKIKSIKGITGIWLEEATEFTEQDFITIDLCLRELGPGYHQIILSFNPDEARGPWIKERFFFTDTIATGPGKAEDSWLHHSTVEDNPIAEVRARYLTVLERLSGQNATQYKIDRLGIWALAEGVIYPNWDVWKRPLPEGMDGVIYGLDFGYSVDPAAFIKVYRKADEYWLEELIYETGLTNQDLARKIKAHPGYDIETAIIYADSAEPKSIEELCREDILVKPCQKGADSRRSGIDFVCSRTVHIMPGSENIMRERKSYVRKLDKNGKPLPEPVDYENHAMDAIRYAIVTDYQEGIGDMELIVL